METRKRKCTVDVGLEKAEVWDDGKDEAQDMSRTMFVFFLSSLATTISDSPGSIRRLLDKLDSAPLYYQDADCFFLPNFHPLTLRPYVLAVSFRMSLPIPGLFFQVQKSSWANKPCSAKL
jgi:hypothetical protein